MNLDGLSEDSSKTDLETKPSFSYREFPQQALPNFFRRHSASVMFNKNKDNNSPTKAVERKVSVAADSAPIISLPFSFKHETHVEFDPDSLHYQGLPEQWSGTISKQFGLNWPHLETRKFDCYESRIPAVLCVLKDCLIQNGGILEEGIFRLAPDRLQSESLKCKIEKGQFSEAKEKYEMNCIANLIKVWFRELPESLLAVIPYEKILNCSTPDDAIEIINTCVEPNKSVIEWLLDLCVEVAYHSDKNKMSLQALAIVFAPNLFNYELLSGPGISVNFLVFSQKVANFLYLAMCFRRSLRTKEALPDTGIQPAKLIPRESASASMCISSCEHQEKISKISPQIQNPIQSKKNKPKPPQKPCPKKPTPLKLPKSESLVNPPKKLPGTPYKKVPVPNTPNQKIPIPNITNQLNQLMKRAERDIIKAEKNNQNTSDILKPSDI